MKHIKTFENFLINEDVDSLRNDLNHFIFLKDKNVYWPQNASANRSGNAGVTDKNNDSELDYTAKDNKLSYFKVSPDGKILNCIDYSGKFSKENPNEVLAAFNQAHKKECEQIQIHR